MIITLPPLPPMAMTITGEGPPMDGHWYTADQIRARDIQVARVVLEAAAAWFETEGHIEATWEVSDLMHALRIEGETP